MSVTPIEQARVLRAEAREHKRLEAFHRRRAQERMEDLRRFCARVGIAIEYVKEETEAEEGHGPRLAHTR